MDEHPVTRWERLAQTARGLGRRLQRRARAERLRVEVTRLEARIENEKVRIGKALYPLVEQAQITVELPEVQEGVENIARLAQELADRRDRLGVLRAGEDEEPAP